MAGNFGSYKAVYGDANTCLGCKFLVTVYGLRGQYHGACVRHPPDAVTGARPYIHEDTIRCGEYAEKGEK